MTGERTVPGIDVENYWFRRHEAVYRALAGDCRDATVLEAGVGEGYGAALLAGVARHVVGLELDAPTAAHVARRYGDTLDVTRADLQALPLPDAAVDVVVTLQVIEHLWDQPGFLRECARVLRPGGRLHCSTPNRLTFSPGNALDDRPLNPFHTYELAATDLAALVDGRRPGGHGDARAAPRTRGSPSATPGTAGRSSTPRSRWRCPARSGRRRSPRTSRR